MIFIYTNRKQILNNQEKWKGFISKGREMCSNKYKENRNKLVEILGGYKCVKCGITDSRCLQIDHVYRGGYGQLRRPLKMYKYYIEHPDEAKEKLQILCANCNWIKRWEDKEFKYKNYL